MHTDAAVIRSRWSAGNIAIIYNYKLQRNYLLLVQACTQLQAAVGRHAHVFARARVHAYDVDICMRCAQTWLIGAGRGVCLSLSLQLAGRASALGTGSS